MKDKLSKALPTHAPYFTSNICRDIKTRYLSIPSSTGKPTQRLIPYLLPNGDQIQLPSHILDETAETLFDTSARISLKDEPGYLSMIMEFWEDADFSLRRDIFQHIVLTGGGSQVPGLVDRVTLGVKSALNPQFAPQVRCSVTEPDAIWTGASLFGELYEMSGVPNFLTQEIYNEIGPSAYRQFQVS